MKCPICDVELKMAERQGIEIDYCPQCRGVWLDRGELDKLIERSLSLQPTERGQASPRSRSGYAYPARERDYPRDRDYEREREHHPRRHKRRSFLDDLFDFD